MAGIRQTSFVAGELSPSLHGRTDIDRYALGLATCRNAIITPTGAWKNRPGTKFIVDTNTDGIKRLVPFIYSETDAYVLEFGDTYIRFIKNGAYVESGGSVYEIATTYTEAQLRQLRFAQVGDVLVITHGSHVPRELTRIAETNWTLTTFSFAAVVTGSIQWGTYGGPFLVSPLPTATGTAPARGWKWAVTQVLQDSATGALVETSAIPVTVSRPGGVYTPSTALSGDIAVYPETPVTVSWFSPFSPIIGWGAYAVVAFRVYRGFGDAKGLVAEVSVGIESFVDTGEQPDYTKQPPRGSNPFAVYGVSGTGASPVRTEEPIAVTFFAQRLCFGGTTERPGNVWLSRTNDFTNFDRKLGPLEYTAEDDPVELALASYRREEMRSLVGLDRLFIFTSSGVWTLDHIGARLVPLAIKHSDEGATWAPPLTVGDSLLYVREKGVGLNEIAFDEQRAKYKTNDLTVFARHLVEEAEIVDLAYAHDPHRIVWAVTADGALLSMTYQREQQVIAWAHHDTPGGTFESVCTIPEGQEDAVYVVVAREIDGTSQRYIERLSTRQVAETWVGAADEAIFLDCAGTYSGAATTIVSGAAIEHLENEYVYVVADGAVGGPFQVFGASMDISASFPDGASEIQFGLLYSSDLELLDVPDGRTVLKGRPKIVRAAIFDVEHSRGFSAGQDFDKTLRPWRQHTVSSGYSPPPVETAEVRVITDGSWNTGGRAVLRQTNPLPLTVVGATREVEIGGD